MGQILSWAGAFAVATVSYRSRAHRCRRRFQLGLWLGVVWTFVGGGMLGSADLALEPGRVLRPSGFSVLFLPLGVLVAAPFREALAALPLALAVARVGCLPYGCCYEAIWRATPEICTLLGLHFAARRWPFRATPIVLCGFGLVRLLSLPLRRELGVEPFVDPAWIAAAWIVAGVMLRNRIGSAENAREWFTERTQPLLRALVVMLLVWLFFPLCGEAFEDTATAALAASSAALALLLALRRPLVPHVSLRSVGVLGGALLVGVAVAAMADAGVERLGFTGRPGVPAGAAGVVALVAIAPAFEELLYRERLLGVLRPLWGGPWAVVASSALFALGHVDPRVMPVAFAGGLVCGTVMLRTGSLAAVIGLHAGWNLGIVGIT